ncbi:MAG: CHAT domain-containing protein [Thermodesulfobacteriota bacterium]|nr:CHAT domain-containing protein [Thermodesulfobacteriota bacterium]
MTPELTLGIQKQGERYTTVVSADGFEDERIYPDPDRIKSIVSKSDLIESFITDHNSHRFASDLIQTGLDMYGLFLEPYSKLAEFPQRNASRVIRINIQTNQHDLSNLPWELLYTPEYQFLAVSPRVKLLRTRDKSGENNGKDLPPGPLRILFMACSPDGTEPLLNYENEEEIIINAVADLKRNKDLVIHIAEGGTLEELKRMLTKEEYHVVHLTGHGHYDDKEQMGYLSMERESGLEDRVSAKRLAEPLLDKHTVRLVFLSACYTGAQKSAGTGLPTHYWTTASP